jgi:hypothetical protein
VKRLLLPSLSLVLALGVVLSAQLPFGGTPSTNPPIVFVNSSSSFVPVLTVGGVLTSGSLVTGTASTQALTASSVLGTGGISSGAAGYLSIATRGYFSATADGLWAFQNAAGTIGSTFKVDALPTIQAGWGTGPSVIAGSTPLAGGVNVGTGGVAGSGSINFNGTAFPQAPFCVTSINSLTGFLQTQSTTTGLTIGSNAAFASGAQVYWICVSQK